MAWDSTPWFVGGGAQHSPEVARLLAYAASGGAEGVVEPGDLKVSPLAVPGAGVRVLPGGVLLRNTYPGGSLQSYVGRLPVQDTPAITATGSSGGRSDLVVARVLDPQYEGGAPSDPTDFEYMRTAVVQGVPAGTRDVAGLALGYPAVPLARIDLPASTGTVTAGMITDLRKVARPRSQRVVRALNNADVHTLTAAALVQWPIGAAWQIDVPAWATHAVISAFATQVDPIWSSTATNGWLTVRLGSVQADGTVWEVRSAQDVTMTVGVGDEVEIPAGVRGTTVQAATWANRNSGNGSLRWNAGSSLILDVEFQERAS
ncbi:hypothetical protein ACIOWF_06715 [Cellulosimicrobium cellulans]|uniref:hypothetical protein n=1 Tax=Cellulosimicrobium cellulans TaxID=1710 RepID=UPI0038169F13